MSISSAQRFTQRSLNERVGSNLQRNGTALGKLQQQLSSGRAISRPSDSPTGTVSALRLRSEMRRNEQYARNASDGLGWLGVADTTLTDALTTVTSVRNLALQGSNAATSDTSREAMAAEVNQLRQHVLTLANTRYLEQPIFAGTSGVSAAYDAAGTYQGDGAIVERTVGNGITVQVSLPGTQVFGPAGDDVFKALADVEAHLRTNPGALTADIDKLDAAFVRIQNALSTVGARFHQVEALQGRSEATRASSANQLAEVENIDLPKTIMELELQEVAYQAALGAASRVLQPSLIDFLR